MTNTIVKVFGTESVCNTTPSSFGNNTIIRLVNIGTAPYIITRASNTGSTIGTFTILANSTVICEKSYTDTLASNTTSSFVFATPVAYKN